MNQQTVFFNSISWISGILFSAIGLVNIFWGNDPEFGIFIFALSLVYYPPFNVVFKKLTGYYIPLALKIVLGLFILWSSLGVGELFDKIELMIQSI